MTLNSKISTMSLIIIQFYSYKEYNNFFLKIRFLKIFVKLIKLLAIPENQEF